MREARVRTTDEPATRSPVLALGLLTFAYGLNFLDRQILGILLGQIKAEFLLTDTQLGLLSGIAFALFYATLAVPIALLADRYNRVWIVTAALTLWSGFTALCGYATGFWSLFLARVGVGVGEAGGVAPSYSLVADLFPPSARARALAVFSMAVPIGGSLGVFIGGWIASEAGWRTAFIAVGLAGVIFAPLFRLLMREPRRGRFDPPAPAAPPIGETLRLLRSKPAFWLLAFGASASSMMGYGLIGWLPSFFQRSFGLTLIETSRFYSALGLIGGVTGIWLGGWLGDRLGKRSRSAYARVPAMAFLAAIPFYLAGLSTGSLAVAFVTFLIPSALSLAWLGPTLAAVQGMVPPATRATASAIFLLVNNLIGIGLGTLFLGAVSDALAARFGDQSLRWAIIAGMPLYLLAAGLFWAASRRLARDWP